MPVVGVLGSLRPHRSALLRAYVILVLAAAGMVSLFGGFAWTDLLVVVFVCFAIVQLLVLGGVFVSLKRLASSVEKLRFEMDKKLDPAVAGRHREADLFGEFLHGHAAVGLQQAEDLAVDGVESMHWDELSGWSQIVVIYPNIRLYVARI